MKETKGLNSFRLRSCDKMIQYTKLNYLQNNYIKMSLLGKW